MKQLVFHTDLTLEDYKGLCWLMVSKTAYVMVIAADIFICMMLLRFFVGMEWLLALLAIALLFVLYFLARGYVNSRSKRIYNMSTVSDELTLTLDESGITQMSNAGETKLAWEDVYRVTENKTCFFVFLERNKAFYFPKRNFESQEQQALFIEYIIEYVSPVKVKFK